MLLHVIMKGCLEIISFCPFPESDANESMPKATTYATSKMLNSTSREANIKDAN